MTDAVTSSCLGVIAHPGGGLSVEPVERAEPAPHEAVVRIAYGGICGSDLHYWLHGAVGESIVRSPMLLGHEVVGTVAVAAADGSGPAAGTPVAVHPGAESAAGAAQNPPAGIRPRHPAHRPNLSPTATYLGSAARTPHTEGAFVRFANLPTRMLRHLPAHLDLRRAALAEPAAVAWHAVARAGDLHGVRALVVGCGPVGGLIVASLRRAGVAEIVASDVYERPLEVARALGATDTITAGEAEAMAAVDADVVFEASGDYRGLESAVRGATRGGRVVMVGLPPTGEQPALLSLMITRELELVGSFRFNDEIDEVIAALADGSLQVDPIVSHEFPVQQAQAAFETARDSARSGKVLLRF